MRNIYNWAKPTRGPKSQKDSTGENLMKPVATRRGLSCQTSGVSSLGEALELWCEGLHVLQVYTPLQFAPKKRWSPQDNVR